jgi:two-component sensor histidine kinase
MQAPPHPRNEERLAALRAFDVLDSPAEAEFDEVVAMLARMCDVPVAVVSLVDEHRQWFKARCGVDLDGTPIDRALCAHAILQDDLMVVPDTLCDPRFVDNPLCIEYPKYRFYAGATLMTREGLALGTVCVLDHRPRELNADQLNLLRVTANLVMRQLELRQALRAQQEVGRELAASLERNQLLLREIDHRVASSLQQVNSFLQMQALSAKTAEERESLEAAEARVMAVARVHQHLYTGADLRTVQLAGFLSGLCSSLQDNAPPGVQLKVEAEPLLVEARRASALGIIVTELVANAFKYAFPAGGPGSVQVCVRAADGRLELRVRDDGRGVDEGAAPQGTGVGMRIVRGLARSLKAVLSVHAPGRGTEVRLAVPLG